MFSLNNARSWLTVFASCLIVFLSACALDQSYRSTTVEASEHKQKLIGLTDPQVRAKFAQANKSPWQDELTYSGSQPWSTLFFLDGKLAQIENSAAGMVYAAGTKEYDDAHHAVLWTKQVFEGDIKIEYEYTRTDNAIRNVTILYLFAQGVGAPGYDKDIAAWSDKRTVPAMRNYFEFMEAYQLSYAAYGTRTEKKLPDYIRARRYMPGLLLKGTEMQPDIYQDTGMFEPGVPHKITAIKKGHDLFFQVVNAETAFLAHWDTRQFPDLDKGRIGFRHMYTRSARYRNMKISSIKR